MPEEKGLLHLNRRFSRYQRNRSLLRILRVYLHDRQIRSARPNRFNHHAQQRAVSTDARSVRLARGGNNGLSVLLVDALDNGNFLCTAGKKVPWRASSMLITAGLY